MIVAVRRHPQAVRLSEDPEWAELLPHQRTRQSVARGPEGPTAVGSDQQDIDAVTSFCLAHGLRVVEASAHDSRVVVEGAAEDLRRAFGDGGSDKPAPGGPRAGGGGALRSAATLHGVVVGVFGLHDRPVVGPLPIKVAPPRGSRPTVTAADLIERYQFPDETGTGQRVAIIELGGGFRPEDLVTFFAPRPVPTVTVVEVGGASNRPEPVADVAALMEWMAAVARGEVPTTQPPDAGRSTYEVTMDIQLVGAFAPDAEIVVYFADNTEVGLLDAFHEVLDPAGQRPSVVSVSWSWAEAGTPLERRINDVLADAAHAGLTVCVASGDYGSTGPPDPSDPDDHLCPEFPGTSHYALACGGTTLEHQDGRIHDEVVWTTPVGMSSGGGVSAGFARPPWQTGHGVPTRPDGFVGRGIPDVSAVADPTTHIDVFAGGQWGPASGTSAAAPLWAGLIARLNESLGTRVGYLNPLLYRLALAQPSITLDVIKGSNGAYVAGPGWDACSGVGSPDGKKLLAALRGS